MKFILAKKIGMTQIFVDRTLIPVTLLEATPSQVVQVKSAKGKDGYDAVKLGFGKVNKPKRIKKTMKGQEFGCLREFRLSEPEMKNYQLGDKVDLGIFDEGDKVLVSGFSKGKGTAGAVKKWGFKGRLSSTHGTKHELRTLGSVGSSNPDRVRKGRRMPGRLGNERVTVKNLEVVKVDKEHNILAVRGALPGRPGTLLEVVKK